MKKDKEFRTVRGYQRLNSENKILTSCLEDYLEMIYRIYLQDEFIRINQLAKKLNVRPSSATKVVQKLNSLNMVNYEKYEIIKLTNEGIETGKYLLRRHNIIEEFLKKIGVEESLLKDTEMIEHDMSIKTVECLFAFNEFLECKPSICMEYIEFKNNICKELDMYNDEC
ncbi:MAG: metal-dependent transcriptional regulator [Clostridiaceae bacterium]